MKRNLEPILGSSCLIRPLRDGDLPLTLAWRNKERIRIGFFDSKELTENQHRNWYSGYSSREDDFVFLIEDAGTQRPIGQVSLYAIDLIQRTAEFGRLMIGEDAALGQGFAEEASRLVLDFGFSVLQLDKVFLEVKPENEAAIKLYEKLGFERVESNSSLIKMMICRV